MLAFHLVILTAIPLGVPLEWNVFMIFGIGSLFVAQAHIGLGDLQYPWLVAALMAVIVVTVARQPVPPEGGIPAGNALLAGNWDISVWCLTESAMPKLVTAVSESDCHNTSRCKHAWAPTGH